MDNKYLKRRFSVREIVLLLVLTIVLFVGLYFALVYYPLKQSNDTLDDQLSQIDGDLVVAQALRSNYDMQKAAIERFKESNTDKMPKCTDEQQKVLAGHFLTVFGSPDNARVTWSNPTAPDAGVCQRRVSISFNIAEAPADGTVYDGAVNMLSKLMSSGFRCAMIDLSLSAKDGGDLATATSIDVRCTICFYELG